MNKQIIDMIRSFLIISHLIMHTHHKLFPYKPSKQQSMFIVRKKTFIVISYERKHCSICGALVPY